jgi:hypothetical protein
MEDPVRFSQGDDDTAKRLMLSMRDEKPPDGAMNRALIGLGVTTAAVVTTGSALGTGATTAGKSVAWLALKWVGAGAVLGIAVGTGATLLEPAPATKAASTTAPVVVDEAPQPVVTATFTTKQSPATTPDVPEQRTAPRTATPSAPEETPAAAAPDTLPREVELLDDARSALQRGAANDALTALDRYSREFPRGRLSTEALVLRIDALSRAGRTSEAKSLGERFLAANPGSPHAARIQKAIGK